MAQSLSPPYKNTQGAYYTRGLFWDVSKVLPHNLRSIDAVFDLYQDRPGLINARATFVELGDPTGYRWAIKYLGDWHHWEILMKCKWFKEAYDVWVHELNVKLRSDAVDRIKEISDGGTQQSLAAAKYLADMAKPKVYGRGRPSSAEISGELKRAVKVLETEEADMERIGLKVVK